MKKKPKKPGKPKEKQRELAIPLEYIRKAYISAEGSLSAAAAACDISVRRYKDYIYDIYKKEMAETIEDLIEKRADRITRITSKLLDTIEKKADLSLEIMSASKEERKPENFALLPLFNLKEQQFFIFLMQIYAKHRGFSLSYNPQDYSIGDNEKAFTEEDSQILEGAIRETAKKKPELLNELRVIIGGKA